MSLPVPKPGLVIRYRFLWSSEHAEGAAEGVKDRPCAIVVAARRDPSGEIQTVVAPITHQPPEDPAASIEIPAATCRSLGLDSGRHWLRLDELNRFSWPGYDLRPLPGQPGRYDHECCHLAFSGSCATVSSPGRKRGRGASFLAMKNRRAKPDSSEAAASDAESRALTIRLRPVRLRAPTSSRP